MDVNIDENGNANITEVWDANLTSGTEGYRAFSKLGNATISNFSVIDENGKEYTALQKWNTKANFDSKAYKSGINYVSNGLELCWGISEYGHRTYTLKYNIENFVTQYTDIQGIYFNFLNLKQEIGKAKITIHSDKIDFSYENSKIWAFGNNGNINFVNGTIVMDSNGELSSSQYMVALVKLENNVFNLGDSNKSSESFDDIYESAFKSVKKTENLNGSSRMFSSVMGLIVSLVFTLAPGLILIVLVVITIIVMGKVSNNNSSGYLDFGPIGNKLPPNNEIEYWREVPCDKDLERAYWVAYQYNIVPVSELKQGIVGAILLKWIKQGIVTVSKAKKGLFDIKNNNYAIDFNNVQDVPNEIENRLLQILIDASGKNRILESNEFKKWCKNNYDELDTWFSKIIGIEQLKLEQQGLITQSSKECKGLFGKTKIIKVKNVGKELQDDAMHLKGLMKFLLDFSIMPEREDFEVHIWDEYLIFAELLGIAEKVEKQFSKVYPDFNKVSKLDIENTTIAIRGIAEIGYNAIEAGRRRERASSSTSYRDSGGGGRSYSSGGESSGGSSGGGFR